MSAAEPFEQYRSKIKAIAYRMLGSVADAEDVVQDVFLRWVRENTSELRSPEAWLKAVTTRLCIDRLRHRAAEREAYPGHWLPEPIVEEPGDGPEHRLNLVSDLSLAFLIVLERLSPDERAAFLLHDVFDCEYEEVAGAIAKSEAACRQLVARARKRLRDERPRFEVSKQAHARLVETFLSAIESPDPDVLRRILAEDVRVTSDGGGKVRVSAEGIFGVDHVVRLIQHSRLIPKELKTPGRSVTRHVVPFNGQDGILTLIDGKPVSAIAVDTDGVRIRAIYQIVNPDKLVHIHGVQGIDR